MQILCKFRIYSNFGYLLLGKIIERVSGVPYEQFVKDAVWSAVGVHETQLATQRISEKAPREVLYYMSGNLFDHVWKKIENLHVF
jgi:CubicO group peptidase (beta-lactamase class C family)